MKHARPWMFAALVCTSVPVFAQAVLVKEMYAGSNAGVPGGFNFYWGALEDSIGFLGIDATNATQPWRTDGSGPGTQFISGVVGSNGNYIRNFGSADIYWFFAADNGFSGDQLWRTDGSAAETIALTPANGEMSASSGIVFGNRLVFTRAPNLASNRTLWVTDGLTATEVSSTIGVSSEFVRIGGKLYFGCRIDGDERLCDYNGTAIGEVFDFDLAGVTNQIAPVAVNDRLFFTTSTTTAGAELWVSDLTAAGTHIVKDIVSGNGSSSPQFVTRVDDRVFFFAGDASAGREVWYSDGSDAGTQRITDLRPGVQDGATGQFPAGFNGRMLFSGNDGTGSAPYVTDGSAAGTIKIANTTSISYLSRPFGDQVLFTAGGRLWITAGTVATTAQLDTAFIPASDPILFEGDLLLPGTRTDTQVTQGNELWRYPLIDQRGMTWCADPESNLFDIATTKSILNIRDDRLIGDLDVSLDLFHSYLGDLQVVLRNASTNTSVVLKAASSCSTGKILDMVFDDAAAQTLSATCTTNRITVPINSVLRPAAALSAFRGQSFGSVWELQVIDGAVDDTGVLHNWCLRATELTDGIFANSFE